MTPINNTTNVISNELVTEEMTNKTYKIDFERKRIVEKIDGYDALKQAIFFILNTTRYKHIIYSHNFGTELNNAIGLEFDLAKAEVERYIRESILSDDRFIEIRNYNTSQIDSESLNVSFDVLTYLGTTINVEQVVNA